MLCKGYYFASISAVLFGLAYVLAKQADSDPLILATFAYLSAGALLTPISRKPLGKNIRLLIAISLCGAVIGPALVYYGMQQIPASRVALLENTQLIFTVIIAMFFFGQTVRAKALIGIAIVITGVALLNQDFKFALADVVVVIGSAFSALDNNLSERAINRGANVMRLLQLKYLIGAGILVAIDIALHKSFSISIEGAIVTGIVGSAAANYMFYKSIESIGAVSSMVILSTYNVFALAFAWMLLGERPNITVFTCALTLILVGIFVYARFNTVKEQLVLLQ